MTENQEKELFHTLATLVTGVNAIQGDVKEIKETLGKHSQTLDSHSQILNSHSQILKRLDAKTDTIADTVMSHESRLAKAEETIVGLQSGIH